MVYWRIPASTVTMVFVVCSTLLCGNHTFDFLRNDVSARAAALGGSFVTATNDPNTIFYNPAGLSTLDRQTVSVGFFKHLLDINAGYASFGTDIPNFGNVGAGIVYVNYGEFRQTGDEGQDLGTFGAGELALTLGYGGRFAPDLRYGMGAKFIYSSIGAYSSSGAAVDLGMQYVLVPERLLVGVSLLNLGTQFSPYINTREDLPLDLKVGATLTPEHFPAVLFVDFHKLNETADNIGERLKAFSLGAEFTMSPNVFLRTGFNNERRQELKIGQSAGLAGFSIGAGFTTDIYAVDYAFNSLGSVGSLHRVSISFH